MLLWKLFNYKKYKKEKLFYRFIYWTLDVWDDDWENNKSFKIKGGPKGQLSLFLDIENTEVEDCDFNDATKTFNSACNNFKIKALCSSQGIFDLIKLVMDQTQCTPPIHKALFKNANLVWLFDWYNTFSKNNDIIFRLENLDNPGWQLEIDLSRTEYSKRMSESILVEHSEQDWISFNFSDGILQIYGGPLNLYGMIDEFQQWLQGDWEKRKQTLMKYTKQELHLNKVMGEELKSLLDDGFSGQDISEWTHHFFRRTGGNMPVEDNRILATIYDMLLSGKTDFAQSKVVLEDLANNLINEEKEPLLRMQEFIRAKMNQPQHKALKREMGEYLRNELEHGLDKKKIKDWSIGFCAAHRENSTEEIEDLFKLILDNDSAKEILEKMATMLIQGDEEVYSKIHTMIQRERYDRTYFI